MLHFSPQSLAGTAIGAHEFYHFDTIPFFQITDGSQGVHTNKTAFIALKERFLLGKATGFRLDGLMDRLHHAVMSVLSAVGEVSKYEQRQAIKKAPHCKARQLKCFHNGIILIVICFQIVVQV